MEQESTAPEPQQQTELEKLKLELNEYKDKYFRALAETENMRKRLQKEKIEAQSFAIQGVVVDFLQPLDHFAQALKASENASQEVRHWVVGFQMILNQCLQVLQDNGIAPFNSVGQQFDPHMHEAIETLETTEYTEGVVVEEFSRGYKIGSRVMRPAKVKVAVAPGAANASSAASEQELCKE